MLHYAYFIFILNDELNFMNGWWCLRSVPMSWLPLCLMIFYCLNGFY